MATKTTLKEKTPKAEKAIKPIRTKVAKTKAVKPAKVIKSPTPIKGNVVNTGAILRNPRITEKSTMKSEIGVYTFDVSIAATKPEIKKAVAMLFGVTPVKVNIITIPRKSVFIRGSKGVKGGGKKACIYLKKGETIDLL